MDNKTTSPEEILNKVGKEYISKNSDIINIADYFITMVTNNIFVIKNTLQLLNSQLQNYEEWNNLNINEAKLFMELIKGYISEMFVNVRRTRIKLLTVSKPNIFSKDDDKLSSIHLEKYELVYNEIITLLNDFITEVINPLFSLRKTINDVISIHSDIEYYYRVYDIISVKINTTLKLLKKMIEKKSKITTHISKYRNALLKQNKISKIVEEIYNSKPIESRNNDIPIDAESLKEGDIFEKPLYTKKSLLIKEAYLPITKADLSKLREIKAYYLYHHKVIGADFKPEDYTIFIIDDERAYTDPLENELTELNFNVKVYNDPKSGFRELMNNNLPDVLLLDLSMPVLNGLEILDSLYNENYGILKKEFPIIMATSHKDKRLIEKCINLGAYDYIAKPFQLDELIEKITSYLYVTN